MTVLSDENQDTLAHNNIATVLCAQEPPSTAKPEVENQDYSGSRNINWSQERMGTKSSTCQVLLLAHDELNCFSGTRARTTGC